MSEFWSAAFGALLGLSTGLATEWWKSGREDLQELCKEFCDVVAEGADAGAEFWLTSAADPQAPLLQARARGFQTRLDGYATILDGRLDSEMLDEVESALALLFAELTGGDPDDPARIPSKPKAFAVHDAAGAAIVSIRRAAYSRMSFKQRVYRYCDRSWVNRARTMRLPPKNPFGGP